MAEVPKIVHDRLRAALPDRPVSEASHPDPDVLTAFSEQALSAAERESVLEHLARCGDCRELLALSIPPTESGAPGMAREQSEASARAMGLKQRETGGRQAWFSWPGLRWAALAAGIAVAGAVLLIHPGKPNAVREARQGPASTVARPNETIVAQKAVPTGDAGLNPTKVETKPAPAPRAFSRDKESKLASWTAAPAKKARADGPIEARSANKDLLAGAVAGNAVAAAPTSPAPAPRIPSASEMVEVTSESAGVATVEARDEPPVNGRQVTDLGTISKAKSAKTESNSPSALQRSESLDRKQAATDTAAGQQHAAAAMSAGASESRLKADTSNLLQLAEHPVQWAIAGNDLQRSLDSGAAWKTVLHSGRSLLCYATGGSEIWAGGKGGDLFHSANGGVTWNRVHPSAQEQTLSDDVIHIDLYSSQIVVFTSNHQSWSTADGGKTWARK